MFSLLRPGEIVGPTPGTAFVGSGNIATDTASLLGKGAADTLARMRDKALGKLDRPVFEIQGVQHVPLWDHTVGNLTGLFRGEAPRLRGAVTPGQQDFPWLETGRRLGYNIESLLRGGQHLGLTRQRLSPQAIADKIWKAHFAYNRLSDFEKNVMRRVVPYYTFTSRNIPLKLVPRLAIKGELVLHGNLSCSRVYNGCHTSFDKLLLAEKRAAHDRRLRGTDVRVTYQYHVDGAVGWKRFPYAGESRFTTNHMWKADRAEPVSRPSEIAAPASPGARPSG